MAIVPDQFAGDVMRQWPMTIKVVLDFKMKCVGWPIGRFHANTDACREHGVDLDLFFDRLNRGTAATQTNDAR